jgi:hypothetical protein
MKNTYDDLPRPINTLEKFEVAKAIIGKNRAGGGEDFEALCNKVSLYLHPDIIQAGKVLNEKFGDKTYLYDALEIYLLRNIEGKNKFEIPSEEQSFCAITRNVENILVNADIKSIKTYEHSQNPKFQKYDYVDSTVLFAERYNAGLDCELKALEEKNSVFKALGHVARDVVVSAEAEMLQKNLTIGDIQHSLCHIAEWNKSWQEDKPNPDKVAEFGYFVQGLNLARKSARHLENIPKNTQLLTNEKNVMHVINDHHKGTEKYFGANLIEAERSLKNRVMKNTLLECRTGRNHSVFEGR